MFSCYSKNVIMFIIGLLIEVVVGEIIIYCFFMIFYFWYFIVKLVNFNIIYVENL